MRKYYLHDGRVQKGPFTLEQLAEQPLHANTSIWRNDLPEWTTVANLDELRSLIIQKPPVFNAPPPFSGKKRRTTALAIGIIVLSAVIIGYLLNQNSRHQKEILIVQTTFYEKQKEDEARQRESDSLRAKDNALAFKNIQYRNRCKRFILLSGGKYLTSGFGGIKGLDLTVYNNTEYPVDNVGVQIDYIKSAGGIYKTETIAFGIIPSATSKTLAAPESDRGTSVQIRIQRVKAAVFHFSYDKAYEMEVDRNGYSTSPVGISGNASDPWNCK